MKDSLVYAMYARKSSEDKHKQSQSIDDQLFELKKIAQRNGIVVDKKYIFTEERSAKNPNNRPKFTKMMQLVESNKIQGILTWQINRLARNPAEHGLLQQYLQDGKIKHIHTYDKTYNQDDNVLILGVEAGISSQFIIDLRKNVKRGIRQKARSGGIGGIAPEGYRNVRVHNQNIVEADPIRFPKIRKAFDCYLSGNYTVAEIKKMLDDCGYITIDRNVHGNKPISRTALYNIFSNIRYTGAVPDPDFPDDIDKAINKGQYPAMIPRNEYDRVQVLLGRQGRTRHVTKKHFELRGLLKCGECGCSVTAERKSKVLKNGQVNYHTYYHCTKKKPCSQKGMREQELFDQLDALLSQYEISPQLYEWGLKAIKDIAQDEINLRDNTQKMHFETIDSIQKKLDRFLDHLGDDVIDADTYKRKTAPLLVELKLRQDEQKDVARRARNWYEIIGNTLERLTDATQQFKTGDIYKRRDILLAIGYNPVLLNKAVVITPNPWMIPIQNELPVLKEQMSKVRTNTQQIKKVPEGTDLSYWCGFQG